MVRSFSDMMGGSPIASDINSHQSTYVTNFAIDEKLQGILLVPLFYVIFRPLT